MDVDGGDEELESRFARVELAIRRPAWGEGQCIGRPSPRPEMFRVRGRRIGPPACSACCERPPPPGFPRIWPNWLPLWVDFWRPACGFRACFRSLLRCLSPCLSFAALTFATGCLAGACLCLHATGLPFERHFLGGRNESLPIVLFPRSLNTRCWGSLCVRALSFPPAEYCFGGVFPLWPVKRDYSHPFFLYTVLSDFHAD